MTTSERVFETLKYIIIVLVTFIVLQAILVVMHEFTHSTVAWLLGHMRSPLDIVWGNPLTLSGWDEGVSYTGLFASGQLHAAAVIGVSPLIVHTVIVTLGLVLMQRKGLQSRKWLFHVIFWFVIANLMELINYIVMRAFAFHGDTGLFNRGMQLSPWILFILGTSAIILGLYILFARILPLMYAIFAQGNRLTEWAILMMTAFFLFIWGSGIRVVFDGYPDPQWMFGLLGFAAFCIIPFICNPSGATVQHGHNHDN